MVAPRKEDQVRPVIIIKKVEDEHDDHHGGVWKIAFADFMTAMMAFFLVMWLINAANEATKAQVASYFNPVKLTAATPARRGVKSIEENATTVDDPQTEEAEAESNSSKPTASSDDENEKKVGAGPDSDDALFSDPYAVLSEIAGAPKRYPLPDNLVAVVPNSVGQKGGEAFRDPFDPAFWTDPPERKDEPPQVPQSSIITAPKKDKQTVLHIESDGQIKLEMEKPATDDRKQLPGTKHQAEAVRTAQEAEHQHKFKSKNDASDAVASKRDADYQQLRSQLLQAGQASREKIPGRLTVSKTDEGVVVSLTDSFDAEMFRTSSARPTAAMVRLVDRLSEVLKRRPGKIVIRGHTDARPFSSNNYDNWRLSTARAHAARHMLLRGGFPAARIDHIEGYADRNLKNKAKPFASENRRIEILLVEDKA